MEQSTAKVVPDTNQGKVEPSPRSPYPGSRIPDSPSLIVGGVATAPVASAPCPTTKPKKPIKTGLPEEFGISDRVRQWAKEKGYDRLAEHLESFVSKCKAKGYTYIDWDEGFMGAVRGDWAKLRVNEPPPPTADPDSRASVEQEGDRRASGAGTKPRSTGGQTRPRARFSASRIEPQSTRWHGREQGSTRTNGREGMNAVHNPTRLAGHDGREPWLQSLRLSRARSSTRTLRNCGGGSRKRSNPPWLARQGRSCICPPPGPTKPRSRAESPVRRRAGEAVGGGAVMRFLSVCSGIEAASVAWAPLGWRAVAFAEIEPFPCALLAHHYPTRPTGAT